MRNIVIKTILMFSVAMFPMWASAAKINIQDGPSLDIWGFAQIVAESIDKDKNDDLKFTADRVRIGTKMKWGQWFGGMHFDARGTSGENKEGTLGDDTFIRDVFIGYQFNNAFKVSAGQFKAPLGMAYTMSGSDLPLMRRTMSSLLTLDRVLGIKVSGQHIGNPKKKIGFSYDLGVFNPAGRAQAYVDTDLNSEGDDLSYVARVGYDYGKTFHVEASYGLIEDAGGECVFAEQDSTLVAVCNRDAFDPESEDYEVFDIGAVYQKGRFRLRMEYIDGEGVAGIPDLDEQSWFVESGIQFNDMVEAVVRYQNSEIECDGDCVVAIIDDGNRVSLDGNRVSLVGDQEQELSRVEVGLNLFLGQNRKNGRVQLYFAQVGEDEDEYLGFAGDKNNKYDMVGAQLQLAF